MHPGAAPFGRRPPYGAAAYGESFADVYDDWYGELTDVAAVVDTVAGLARGPVLELGVGTGRLALPLADRVADVHGLDASPAMLERLRAKDRSAQVVTHLGDMAGPLPPGPWSVVFVAYNTFFNLDDEPRQRACLAAVHSVLARDGVFVLEAFVPSTTLVPRRAVEVRRRRSGDRVLSVTITDGSRQRAWGAFVELDGPARRYRPWSIRFAPPAELDEMAAGAGLVLAERWGDWDRRQFDGHERHVSLYTALAGGPLP